MRSYSYSFLFLLYFRIYSEAELRNTVLTMAQEDYDFSHRKGSLNFSVEKVESFNSGCIIHVH